MEINYEAIEEAVRDGVVAATKGKTNPPRMMAIKPFEAFDDQGDAVQVIGIYDDDDACLQFICIAEDGEDGMICPVIESSVFRKKAAITQ